jgi:hypothetical protein
MSDQSVLGLDASILRDTLNELPPEAKPADGEDTVRNE